MVTNKHIDKIVAVIVAATVLLCLTAMGFAGASVQAYAGIFDEIDLDMSWATANTPTVVFSGKDIKVSGGAYVSDGDVYICGGGSYILRGTLSDGSIVINAGGHDTVRLLLDGVSLHCSDSAVLRVEQAGKVVLTLADGTDNLLSSGDVYASDIVSSGVDGVIYSRDDLTINGSGSLNIEANYKHGLVCNDTLSIVGGNISISAPEDTIHANDAVRIAEASLTLDAGDDAVTCKNDESSGEVSVLSGDIHITACYEGLEGDTVSISGGNVSILPTDDGINAVTLIDISGGSIYIENSAGRDADGLDSNGDINISGGKVLISVNTSSCALDYGSENGGRCLISGGTVIACGGSNMAESFDSDSPQGFVMTNVSGSSGATVKLKRADGTNLLSETVPCAFTNAVLSAPGLKVGDACVFTVDESVTDLTVDNASSGGFGFGMMGTFGKGDRFSGNTAEDQPEPPQDFDPSQFGNKGGQGSGGFPPNGGELPEGFDPSQFGGGNRGNSEMFSPQAGQTEPSNPESEGGEADSATESPSFGQRPGFADDQQAGAGFMRPNRGDMDFSGFPGAGQSADTSAARTKNLITYGVSFVILLAALAFAVLFKRRSRRR